MSLDGSAALRPCLSVTRRGLACKVDARGGR